MSIPRPSVLITAHTMVWVYLLIAANTIITERNNTLTDIDFRLFACPSHNYTHQKTNYGASVYRQLYRRFPLFAFSFVKKPESVLSRDKYEPRGLKNEFIGLLACPKSRCARKLQSPAPCKLNSELMNL